MAFVSVPEFLLSSTLLAYVGRNVTYSAPVLTEVAVYNPDNSTTEVKNQSQNIHASFQPSQSFLHCTQNTLYPSYFHFKALYALQIFC